MHWILYLAGLTDSAGLPYLFWSGLAGNLVIFSGAWSIYKRHQCHERKCLRIGHFPDGTLHKCYRHKS